MSAITNCPACQTQFVVTDEQLNQYNGKVRCGQCLHVFNAKDELVDSNTQAEPIIIDEETSPTVIDEVQVSQDEYFNSFEKKPIISKAIFPDWLLGVLVGLLSAAAIAQSIYFLRSTIASAYPSTNTFLVSACKKIGCSIELPKKIDLIVIDDSDMQEDADYVGLIHLSSTLINQANFSQAFPNLELTLTDLEDSPKLRRIFKPAAYLPANTDITKGIAAGEEIKIKLPITVKDEVVAGYRIFVNY